MTELDSLEVKIKVEDKVCFCWLRCLFLDNIVTTLLFGKQTLRLDKVVPAL